MIRIILALLAGGGAGYLYGTSREFRRQVKGKTKAVGELGTGFRLPQSGTALELPESLEDFVDVDVAICDCANEFGDPATIQDLVAEGILPELGTISDQEFEMRVDALIQLCAAAAMFPPEDVQWPPVPGDHPSIHQFWGIVGFRLRRIRVFGLADEICPKSASLQPIIRMVDTAAPTELVADTDTPISFGGANLAPTAEIQGVHHNQSEVMFDSVQMGAVTATSAQTVIRASVAGKYTILMRDSPESDWVAQELSITVFGQPAEGGNLAPGG